MCIEDHIDRRDLEERKADDHVDIHVVDIEWLVIVSNVETGRLCIGDAATQPHVVRVESIGLHVVDASVYWNLFLPWWCRDPARSRTHWFNVVGSRTLVRMGTVVALQISLASRMDMRSVDVVRIEDGHGITGDRYENARHRQVTVQTLEEIALAEEEHGAPIKAFDTRRNITVDTGRLDRTPGARATFTNAAGDVVELEVVRDAAPCKLLEDNIGRGAKLAMHKRAGVVYRTISGGEIAIGDTFAMVPFAEN